VQLDRIELWRVANKTPGRIQAPAAHIQTTLGSDSNLQSTGFTDPVSLASGIAGSGFEGAVFERGFSDLCSAKQPADFLTISQVQSLAPDKASSTRISGGKHCNLVVEDSTLHKLLMPGAPKSLTRRGSIVEGGAAA
jgi:hypothetical protein